MRKKFRFTKPKIEALAPPLPGKRDEYRDEALPGHWLRVSSALVKTYAVLALERKAARWSERRLARPTS